MKRDFGTLLRASFKSEDTEEWLDIHFNRPVGLAIALACERLGIHPNAITIASIFLGAAAGVMFYHTDLAHNLAGVALLMTANFGDSADGQLARLTGQKTLLGRVLDGFSGDVWFTTLYVALALRLCPQEMPIVGAQWGLWAFALCFISGILCHSRQSSLADYYRQIHLYFLLGRKGSELDDSSAQREALMAQPKGALFARAFYYFYGNYCRSQEKRTPAFQSFYANARRRWPDASDMPEGLRADFREGSLPLMKYTNVLTFNARAILLYATCLIDMPYIYLLTEAIVFTSLYLYMHHKHESLCRRLNAKYFA